MANPRTLFDKIWDAHLVKDVEDGAAIMYIDRHLVHEVTSPQAFEGLRLAGRKVRSPERTLAVPDHNVPTTADRLTVMEDDEGRLQLETTATLLIVLGKPFADHAHPSRGIEHLLVVLRKSRLGQTLNDLQDALGALRRWGLGGPRRLGLFGLLPD